MTLIEAKEVIVPIYEKYKTRLETDGPVGFQIINQPGIEPCVAFSEYQADPQHGHRMEVGHVLTVEKFKEYCRVKYEVEIRDEKLNQILK